VALDAALTTAGEEQAKQGEIVQRVLDDAGEAVTYYCHVSIATGDLVLGDEPAPLDEPKTVETVIEAIKKVG
jgi:hypothetical protein